MLNLNSKLLYISIFIVIAANITFWGNALMIVFYIYCFYMSFKSGAFNSISKYLFILFIPILLGLFSGIFKYPMYDVFKDVFYFLSPIVQILCGFFIVKKYGMKLTLKACLFVGILTSFLFLLTSLGKFGFGLFSDPRYYRDYYDNQTNVTILLSFFILLFVIFNGRRFNRIILSCFMVNVLAIYITGSRTFWMMALCSFWVIYAPQLKKHLVKYSLLLVFCVSISFLYISSTNNRTMFLLRHSLDEISIQEFETDAEITHNYRGFEAYRAMKQFHSYNLGSQLLGDGFGSTVDLGRSDLIGFRYLPIIHNGYPYILIKSGYLGLICFILFGYSSLKKCLKYLFVKNSNMRMLSTLAFMGILSAFVTNLIVTGLFNSAYNLPLIFVGSFIFYTNKLKKILIKR